MKKILIIDDEESMLGNKGCRQIIAKPIDPEKLLEIIKETLR